MGVETPASLRLRYLGAGLRLNAQRAQRLCQRFRLQYHTFAAAKGTVVHGAVPVVRKCAQIVNADRNQPLGQRPPHDSVLEDAGKELRKDGNDLETHIQMI